jgi:hypothetical protein
MIQNAVAAEMARGGGPAGRMDYSTATIDDLFLRRRLGFARSTAAVVAAFALASSVAAWITDIDPMAWSSNTPPAEPTPFNIRFALNLAPNSSGSDSLRGYPAIESNLQEAKRLLSEKLRAGDRQAELAIATTAPTTAMSVPLPKARPAQANADLQLGRTTQPDGRTFFQKLADLLPARAAFASLTPSDDTPNLRSLGYDSLTAVYDISAHAVYLPNGSRLEAHSGYGDLRDDPGHVNERNVGATPPAVYELKPREQLFHGVPALRMMPTQGSAALGRDGLLAHSYMLGPDGDSNGCVSIKDYDQFLAAFQKGEIVRLVVVPNLSDASRQPLLKS